jgi:hypothetical protein
MARGRSYKLGVFDSATWAPTGATNAGTTSIPVLYWTTSTTSQMNIFNISVGVMGVGTIPSNASVAWSINVATGAVGGGTAAVPVQFTGPTAISSLAATTIKTGGGTTPAAITGLTATTSYWDRVTPFAAGANWEDIVTYGDELELPSTATNYGLFVTPTSAGTSTTFFAEIEWSE